MTIVCGGLKNQVFAQCTALAIVSHGIHFAASSYDLYRATCSANLTAADFRYNEVYTHVLFACFVFSAILFHCRVKRVDTQRDGSCPSVSMR